MLVALNDDVRDLQRANCKFYRRAYPVRLAVGPVRRHKIGHIADDE